MKAFAQRRPAWVSSHRLIPTRFPTVGLFDEIADPEDLDIVFAIEALTNERIRQELGRISLVPPKERVTGSGATLIMAPFVHLSPSGSRFTDGSFGVYYCANTIETAIAEVSHHRAIFMASTAEPPLDLDHTWIRADIIAPLHDVRKVPRSLTNIYSLTSYAASQAFGTTMRSGGSNGLWYRGVMRTEGECAAIFRPNNLARARNAGFVTLVWDGTRIAQSYRKSTPGGV